MLDRKHRIRLEEPVRQHGDPRRNYAEEWRIWRSARGWTQAEAALALDLHVRTVRNVENGVHPPSVTSREKMKSLQKRYREAAA